MIANRARLAILTMLVGSFFAGGVVGAFEFKHAGYVVTLTLALALIAVAIDSAVDDLVAVTRRWAQR